MKKILLLLLFITACTPTFIQKQDVPVIIEPVETEPTPQPAIIEKPRPPLQDNTAKYLVQQKIEPFTLTSTDAIYDNFSIIEVERYDARYQSDITVLVHIFKFSTREELDVVLNSEFYTIINLGTSTHRGHTIAIYLSQENHRAAVWTSGNCLIYVDTGIPDYVDMEILDAYLTKYPSDMKTEQCVDSDGADHLIKGKTNKVKIGSTIMEMTDSCLRDFPFYLNNQYKPLRKMSEADGLLEGRCQHDLTRTGYIEEYVCPRGCENGSCRRS